MRVAKTIYRLKQRKEHREGNLDKISISNCIFQ